MTEAKEIADRIWIVTDSGQRRFLEEATEAEVREIVQRIMPNETWAVIHAVTDALIDIARANQGEYEC
jgi:hypothetical protein